MLQNKRIPIAGYNRLVCKAIRQKLQRHGFTNLLGRCSSKLDLTEKSRVDQIFDTERPEYVFLAAPKIGAISANSDFPGNFLFRNVGIQNNTVNATRRYGVSKLLFIGSFCIYPKIAP